MTDGNQIYRLKFLLKVVEKESLHLEQTSRRLFSVSIDSQWLDNLEHDFDTAERLDAFVARFGRLQDTIADKLIPELLRQSLETPGTVIDNLTRLEKLGLIASVDEWIEARNLRNRLIHEYMRDKEDFLQALLRAKALTPMLIETSHTLREYAAEKILTNTQT